MPYFSGQGRIYIAERNAAGDPDAFRFVGNAPTFDLSFETDVLEHKESITGQRVTDLRLLREKTAGLNLVLEEFDPENLALALFGAQTTIAAGSITDEVLAGGSTNVANGDYLRLANVNLTNIVIKDSNGTPATLVEDTDYRVVSAATGLIEILDIGSYTQPFTADYDNAEAANNVKMLSEGLTEKWIRFDGVNTADGNKPTLVELYRVAFDPTEEFAMISDELTQFSLNGSALADQTKTGDVDLGVFGRVVPIIV